MWQAVAASAVGNLIGGAFGSKSADKAAAAQEAASRAAIEENRRQYDINRADSAPYRQVGQAAVMRLSDLMGLGGSQPSSRSLEDIANELRASGRFSQTQNESAPYHWSVEGGVSNIGYAPTLASALAPKVDEAALMAEAQRIYSSQTQSPSADAGALNKRFTMEDFYNDPVTKAGLDFGMSEGQKAIRRMFGAQGMDRSGAAVKAATRFATDYTGTKAGESSNRFYADQDRTFNRLAGLSGTGQTAMTNTAAMGAQTAANVGNLMVGAGNARGAAAIARGNAIGGTLSNIGSALSSKFLMDSMKPQKQYTMSQPGFVLNAPDF